jgi:GDP-mannose 6-dehydrogenase
MKIAVVGLGYVGTVVAGCLAKAGNEVVGVDIDEGKVDLVNRGLSPIVEPEIGQILKEQVDAGMLSATTGLAACVARASLVLICVGTPSLGNGNGNGKIDLKYLKRVCKEIGQALPRARGYPVVSVRSTVLPGTTRGIVIPILEENSGGRAGVDFGVCMNPEFLREGTAVRDFYDPPKTVIGEFDRESGEVLAAVYSNLPGPQVRTELEAAEMVKYADNAWHALKIGFANEIGNVCKALAVDAHRVMDVFCLDRKLNISATYLKPGFAFGGLCLPKDLRALLSKASQLDVPAPILNAILPSNALQIERGVHAVIDAGNREVGVLGISFKPGTDDLRESPVVELAERLLGKGFDIRIYDRNVSLARVNGANRDHILNRIPHISRLMVPDIDAVLTHGKSIVVGNASPEFACLPKKVRDGQTIIDLVRISNERSAAGFYEGLCW